MLLQDAKSILSIADRPTKTIKVKEWNCEVIIRVLPASFRDKQDEIAAGGGSTFKDWRSRMVAASIVNEKGEAVFNERHVNQLAEKSGKALDSIVEEIIDFNAMGDEHVEEMAKN